MSTPTISRSQLQAFVERSLPIVNSTCYDLTQELRMIDGLEKTKNVVIRCVVELIIQRKTLAIQEHIVQNGIPSPANTPTTHQPRLASNMLPPSKKISSSTSLPLPRLVNSNGKRNFTTSDLFASDDLLPTRDNHPKRRRTGRLGPFSKPLVPLGYVNRSSTVANTQPSSPGLSSESAVPDTQPLPSQVSVLPWSRLCKH